MSTSYPSNLTDREWLCLRRHLPVRLFHRRWPRHSLRTVFDAIFYVLRAGCPWRYLPADFPPWQTAYDHFRRSRLCGIWQITLVALRRAERERIGRCPQPSAAIMDAQSVKTVEESARGSGYDGYKRIEGRKRHLLVDTLGLPLSIEVTPADTPAKAGALRLLPGLAPLVPRLRKIWADGAYTSGKLANWCKRYAGGELEIVGRAPDTMGFTAQPRRWAVERGFAWLVRNRRLRTDYERRLQTNATPIAVAFVRLLLRRLARRG